MNDSGHFFLDYDNGQIGYVFYMPYGSIEEDEDLELLWVVPASRFEEYGDALLKVILGCSAPKAALEESINNSELKEEAN